MTALDNAWQAALAAEQQAVFGYALLGPRLSDDVRFRAVGFSDLHEQLRDSTAAAISAAGLVPVPPAADYPSLYPVDSAAAARALAVRLEDAGAAAWRYLYLQAASTTGSRAAALRATAQRNLTSSAVRATVWRALISPAHATTPFPGIAR
jgi:hypothetical protein